MNDHDLRCFAVDHALRLPFYEMKPAEVQEALLSRAKAIYDFIASSQTPVPMRKANAKARRGAKR